MKGSPTKWFNGTTPRAGEQPDLRAFRPFSFDAPFLQSGAVVMVLDPGILLRGVAGSHVEFA